MGTINVIIFFGASVCGRIKPPSQGIDENSKNKLYFSFF